MREFAKRYQDEGLSMLPLHGKKPTGAWKQYQSAHPTTAELEDWFGDKNIGVVTGRISDLVVVDFDDKQLARDWFKGHREAAKVIVETRRGVHFAFRCADEDVRNRQGVPDIRGEGGYVAWPDSEVLKHKYEFVDGFDDLASRTVYRPEWFPVETTTTTRKEPDRWIERIRNYIGKIVAVSGEGGHNATFRAVCKLRDYGLSEGEAFCEMVIWNKTNADPPWTMEELWHKVCGAYGTEYKESP